MDGASASNEESVTFRRCGLKYGQRFEENFFSRIERFVAEFAVTIALGRFHCRRNTLSRASGMRRPFLPICLAAYRQLSDL